ncbi:hypothetical protein V6N13_083886 [Hibiscus sabdariffa]|uniref:Uncharacterized protein n=1 Tax=Hibiscus sabdariffa TaxID=183260 RepID=A0ABR2SZC7_9ROSI
MKSRTQADPFDPINLDKTTTLNFAHNSPTDGQLGVTNCISGKELSVATTNFAHNSHLNYPTLNYGELRVLDFIYAKELIVPTTNFATHADFILGHLVNTVFLTCKQLIRLPGLVTQACNLSGGTKAKEHWFSQRSRIFCGKNLSCPFQAWSSAMGSWRKPLVSSLLEWKAQREAGFTEPAWKDYRPVSAWIHHVSA